MPAVKIGSDSGLCECGCGASVKLRSSRYLRGHYARTPEWRQHRADKERAGEWRPWTSGTNAVASERGRRAARPLSEDAPAPTSDQPGWGPAQRQAFLDFLRIEAKAAAKTLPL